MREDIYGGLRNAIERGTPLEQAIRSFVNAGYHEPEVREAAKMLEGNAITFTQQPTTRLPPVTPALQTRPQLNQMNQMNTRPMTEMQRPRKKPGLLIIVLLIVLALSVASFIISLLFRRQIADFLARFMTG